ncbi:MAG: type II toxin-antitoxin system PemK/MazF family toxin, partial [Patescibacteria group bacterium]
MLEFGAIILVPFPFTDLSHAKMRPALVVSGASHAGDDIIVCCITSTQKQH